MKNKIVHYKTNQEISNNLYKLLENINPCCNNELYLIKNERSDASYKYRLYCFRCKKILCKIDWSNKVTCPVTLKCSNCGYIFIDHNVGSYDTDYYEELIKNKRCYECGKQSITTK